MTCKQCGTLLSDHVKFCKTCGAKVESVTPSSPYIHDVSAVWPEWRIEKPLGKGSYGTVYQAVRTDHQVESRAAIKVVSIPSDNGEIDSLRSEGIDMNGSRSYFEGIVNDFVSEIRLMESLKGVQNIVSVEDYKVVEKTDTIGWDIYIRMELLTPFNTYLCDKTLTEAEVIKIGCDICTALEICNQRRIIHRDIKPENLFINDFGHFKLGDFGIARRLENVTGGLSQKGTFNYMAPEVAYSREYDARVDVYSLGIVLYRLLNDNRLPFLNTEKQLLNPNERKAAVDRRLRGEALPAPSKASPAMQDVILRACAYNPAARFASATEMKQALLSVANGTYAVAAPVDATVKMRATPDPNATAAVRQAPAAQPTPPAAPAKPTVDTFGETPPKKKSKKGLVIAIAVLSAILALAIGLAAMFLTSDAFGIYRHMNKGEYTQATRQYEHKAKDAFVQEKLLDMLLKDRVNDVATEYNEGTMDYDTAIEALQALETMGFEDATAKMADITVAQNATDALAKADEFAAKGDFENAISEYTKIPESNEHYETAQAKLDQVYQDYIASVAKSAKSQKTSGNYKQAVRQIAAAYEILPDDIDTSELDTIKAECLAAYKTDVAGEVAELTEAEQWADAFDLLDEAIAFDDNDYFQNLKQSTETAFVESVTTKVNGYLDSEDYIAAKRVADNALTVLPGNAALKELQSDVAKATPTYLLDVCQPYSSSGSFKTFVNGETIKMGGNTYTNAFQYEDTGYAIFNMNANYSTMTFYIGHVDGTRMSDTTFKLYCDGILKVEREIKAEALPQKMEIDITGVKQIKFTSTEASGSPACGFGNVTVK